MLKSALSYALIILVTFIVTDTVSYLVLPDRIAHKFGGYRSKISPSTEAVGGRGSYPKDYFMVHPARGFDIKPGARGNHSVDGITYPIWSNSLGCFDREWENVPNGYYYFAGDSSTWGYTPFEDKFASLFEKRTGIPSLKCGVTHTGQLHQFDKFQEVVRKLGVMPKHVIVGYSMNDVANDYAYPHSTVVSGWQVDDVFLTQKDFNKIRVSKEWIETKIVEALANFDSKKASPTLLSRAKDMVKRYSISAQIFRAAVLSIRNVLGLDAGSGLQYEGRTIENIYALTPLHVTDGIFKYGDTKFTGPNRRAITAWNEHAKQRGYRLTFLLIPDRGVHENIEFLNELKKFMENNAIEYIDLAQEFRELGASADVVYWAIDAHMSPKGNRLAAEILVRKLEGEMTPMR